MSGISEDLLRRLGIFGLGLAVAAHLFVIYAPNPPSGPSFPGADKVVHALVFAAPVTIGLLLGLGRRLVPLMAAAHAPVSELVQHVWLPHRHGDVWDVVADLGGVVLGLLVVRGLLAMAGLRLAR